MPIYEYKCTNCGHIFEELRSISDGEGATCPKCGAPAKKIFSGSVGFIFKGSGFYITDYKKSSSSGNGNKMKGKHVKVEEKKGETKTESKKQSTS